MYSFLDIHFFNKLKNFDIKDTEGQTYKTNVSRESRLQQWLVTTGSDKNITPTEWMLYPAHKRILGTMVAHSSYKRKPLLDCRFVFV